MPKISIYEKDLTTIGIDNVTNNTVYIPGYAITGPVNTPVLCETLEQFQETFGYKPYKFKNSQPFPTITIDTVSVGFAEAAKSGDYIALAEEYEKSYIYAAELLKNGLPVLFERVMDTNGWTAQYTQGENAVVIKAKYPGSYGTGFGFKLEADETVTEGEQIKKFKLTLNFSGVTGMKDISNLIYRFSLDPNDTNYYLNFRSPYIDLYIKSDAEVINTVEDTLKLSKTETEDEFTVAYMYEKMADLFDNLEDKGEYQIKFITSGAYPTLEFNNDAIAKEMLAVAGRRGDSVALIDHTDNPSRVLTGTGSVYTYINNNTFKNKIVLGSEDSDEDGRKYGAMFTPHAVYEILTLDRQRHILPGSFGYLISLSESVKTNANWYAVAGVTRGLVPNLIQLNQNITGATAEKFQAPDGVSINPITNIKPYGYCIWGNRTLNFNNGGLIASSFLNIRILSNDVKKVVYTAAKKLTFELNTDVLWLNFKSEIEPTLDKMVSGNGLTGYRILRKATAKRATIEAIIRLFVVEAVEDWDITIELSDTTITIQ